jgi:protein-disulfide isomerase
MCNISWIWRSIWMIGLLLLAACGTNTTQPPLTDQTSAPRTPGLATSAGTIVPAATSEAAPPNPRALGDPNAPITIMEFSDFQ